MTTIRITAGILKGLDLEEYSAAELEAFSRSERTILDRVSYYHGALENVTFRGITFTNCVFAKTTFKRVRFRRCRFTHSDLIRSVFEECYFSGCEFIDSDLYNVSFGASEILTSSFGNCYRQHEDWNKALILFSALRTKLLGEGNTRGARVAEYYLRIWERRRLYSRWRNTDLSGPLPWLWSLFLGSLTGYGERPAYLALWATAVISVWAWLYKLRYPWVIDPVIRRFFAYWFFSFRLFFGQGISLYPGSIGVALLEMFEFGIGLVLVSLLIGSASRKLSS